MKRLSNAPLSPQPLSNEQGFSTLVMAMATVIILASGVSLLMTDMGNSTKTRNHMRLSLLAYNTMEQFALKFVGAFELRNPSWFTAPACPSHPGPPVVNSVDQGAAPNGERYCEWPAQPCPAGTTQVNIVAGTALCVTNDVDNNAGSADFCMRSPTGADYCLDLGGVITKLETDSEGNSIPTIEVEFKDVTPLPRKLESKVYALYDQLKERVQPALETIAPFVGAVPEAQAQAQTFLTARPNPPALAATANDVTIGACPDAVGGPEWCVRCADPLTNCIQIKMCMPPGCGGGEIIYQRIAILRPLPID